MVPVVIVAVVANNVPRFAQLNDLQRMFQLGPTDVETIYRAMNRPRSGDAPPTVIVTGGADRLEAMLERYQGRASGRVRDFALFGDTTGETDEYGLPVRYNWAAEYRGKAMVVYGHTPVAEPEWLNRTINIDTGCVFGGKLTALRYPERELVDVQAARAYVKPPWPMGSVSPS